MKRHVGRTFRGEAGDSRTTILGTEQAKDTYDISPLVGFNVVTAMFLYTALAYQIGQLRDDIRRFAKRKRSDRRQPRSEPDLTR